MTGKTYSTFAEAVKERADWTPFPAGGCASPWGRCLREDASAGNSDHYEPEEYNLAKAGLPWFYFCTLEGLLPDFHERFLKEAWELWPEALDDEREEGGTNA